MSTILSNFPKHQTPRPGQVEALQTIEREWSKADVFVVEIPVGGGKSSVATAVAGWASRQHRLKSLITTPTRLLVDQYLRSNPRLASLHGKDTYECSQGSVKLSDGTGYKLSCKEYSEKLGKNCQGCQYSAACRRIRAVPYGVVNAWTYLAHKLYPDVLIADEAHTLLRMLQDLAAKVLWQRDYQFPDNIKDYRALLRWVTNKRAEIEEDSRPPDKKLEVLWADLSGGAPKYLVEAASEPYRGKLQRCLKLLPIDTSASPPLLWPPTRVKKLVLLSATIGPKDLEQLGLAGRRVCWIRSASPIPAERRPVAIVKPGFDMSYAGQGGTIGNVAAWVKECMERHKGQSGLVHVTYGLASLIRPYFKGDPRALFHTKEDKKQVYEKFLNTPGSVLFCAGLYEGADLPGDLGRFQVITKVPFGSIAEPALKYLADTDPMRYKWEALRLVMQASGRICRGPEDWGCTYIIDRAFEHLPEELFPTWFFESLKSGELI